MFSNNQPVEAAMDEMVVLSLHTDGTGKRKDEFGNLREKLTGSATNPVYIVVSPWNFEKVLYQADYNQAVGAGFADRLGRANRRAKRIAARNETPGAE
ncbi:MAG: hypothetical protein H6807_14190 [Planctomycetes bacterium]|nr:hypothetical protein [Planctomycetota bacterium]